MDIFDSLFFEVGIRLLIVWGVHHDINKNSIDDRSTNPISNGRYFAFFPFYIFVLMSYREAGQSKIDFFAPIFINSIIFGTIAFVIGYLIIKIKKK